MTANKKHKQRVRERMARDGVTYSEALRRVEADRFLCGHHTPGVRCGACGFGHAPTVTLSDGTSVTLHAPEAAPRSRRQPLPDRR